MIHIKAPFSEEQVQQLRIWQLVPFNHPFTCCSPDDIVECERRRMEGEGILKPTTEGLVCPCGKYKQDWCHDYMLNNNHL